MATMLAITPGFLFFHLFLFPQKLHLGLHFFGANKKNAGVVESWQPHH